MFLCVPPFLSTSSSAIHPQTFKRFAQPLLILHRAPQGLERLLEQGRFLEARIGGARNCLLKGRQRLLVALQCKQCLAFGLVRIDEAGVQANSFFNGIQRLRIALEVQQTTGPVMMGWSKPGVKLNRLVKGRHRLGMTLQRAQR